MTLKQAMEESFQQHDCHLSPEDSCEICEKYWNYKKCVEGRVSNSTLACSQDNYPPQANLEHFDDDIVGGVSILWI